jgi:hypothetical protein
LDANKFKADQELARVNQAALSFSPEQQKTTVKETEFDKQMQEARIESERIHLERKIAEQEAAFQKEQAESKKLADEQAKTWAAAELRANELGRSEARPANASHTKADLHQSARKPRAAIPVGKILVGIFVVSILSIWILPYVLNLNEYIAPIEKKLAAQFKQPVHIGALHFDTFPLPKLQLEKVTVGSLQEFKVANISLVFDPFSLFSPVKKIRNVEMQDILLDEPTIEKESAWLQEIGANAEYHASRLTLKNINLSGSDIILPPFNGVIEINGQGRLDKVSFRSVDDKYVFSLQPGQNHWQFSFNAKGTALPIISNIFFDDFTANGEFASASANITEMDAQVFGGFLHGNAKLSWQKNWQLQGRISAKSVELAKLYPKFGVAGELQGESNFSIFGTKPEQITNNLQMDGSFMINKGVVNNMDMIETVRQGNRQTGRTHFDELTGSFQTNARGMHFQQLQITSGIMTGSGSFDVGTSAQISGRFSVTLKAREGTSALMLSGSLTEPILSPVR